LSEGRIGTVLLVEDNDEDVFAFKWAMKKAQAQSELRVAETGLAAVELLSEFRPDLVMLDLKLPYKSGMEVLAWIREQPSLEDLKVVILSGSDEAKDHMKAEELGAAGYLVKPPTPAQISEVYSEAGLA
jgi:DNA-binding response OmpR family regulator